MKVRFRIVVAVIMLMPRKDMRQLNSRWKGKDTGKKKNPNYPDPLFHISIISGCGQIPSGKACSFQSSRKTGIDQTTSHTTPVRPGKPERSSRS